MSCLGSLAFAQPANDECDFAEPIAGYGEFFYDTTDATSTGVQGTDPMADLWFEWTAPQSGPVVLSTCDLATWDTRFAVYEGSCIDPIEIAANDDACGLQSTVEFVASAGATYLIRAGGWSETSRGPASMLISEFTVEIVYELVNPATGHNYALINATTWTGANDNARFLGGELVTINDLDENDWVQFNILQFDDGDRRAWIGYNDIEFEGLFEWSSGEASFFENWSAGEPNNSSGIEHYTEMLGSNGLWNDQSDSGNGVVAFAVVEFTELAGCAADINADGVLDLFDILEYFEAFTLGDVAAADFAPAGAPDGILDLFDILEFLFQFGVGCD